MPFSDEFTAATLNAGWTEIDPASTATLSIVDGALRWVTTATYTDMASWGKTDAARLVQASPGDFDVSFDAGRDPGNNFDGVGMYVDDGTTGTFRSFLAYFDETFNVRPAMMTSGDGGTFGGSRLADLSADVGLGRYQRLRLQNTTLTWHVSADGVTWNQRHSGIWSGGPAQRVGFFVAQDRVVTWNFAYFRSVVQSDTPTTGTADCRVRVNGQWRQSTTRIRVGGAWRA